MSLLVILLPAVASGHYLYTTSSDGQRPGQTGQATLDLLPRAGRGVEVVAVVPARLLSWHKALLPRGTRARSPRLHAILAGLLEDGLLQDPQDVHFALGPEPAADGRQWIATCSRTWLAAQLQALAQVGRPAARIAPAIWPHAGATQATVVGQPGDAWLLASGQAIANGALALPLTPQALMLVQPPDTGSEAAGSAPRLAAEPAVAEAAEQLLGAAVALVAPAQRLLDASQSPWNLAQGAFSRGGAAGLAKRLARGWRHLLHAPQWRPLRWGLVLLVVVQLLGLNLWRQQVRADLAARRAQIDAALTRSFPQVPVVVDAPVQMEREVAVLRRQTGALSAGDLEPMLDALAQAQDASLVPAALEFTPGQLRLDGVQLRAQAVADLQARLRQQGYALQASDTTLTLRLETVP
ncbi:MAG: type II secretion system protein GspL [Ottowia sp.]|nr:type II secretion system protein GspL [Ottowia sp.]